MPLHKAALSALASLFLAACGSLPLIDYQTAAPPGIAPRTELTAVPFHPQEERLCGPAALATVLGAAGLARSQRALEREVYLPGRGGSLQPEMLAAVRRSGALAYVLEPRPETLLTELAAGNPVVVLQDVGLPALPRWHYAVAVGYDLDENSMVLRSGTWERLVVPMAEFDRTWARSGRWAFVALPPNRLPVTARATDFVAAAAALERVSPAAARLAYQAALARWPDNPVAAAGVGNAAYRLGDLEGAAAAFRRVVADHPEAADAWNNLAQVLHELGRAAEASAAARRAVAIGGPREKAYRSTLATVEESLEGH